MIPFPVLMNINYYLPFFSPSYWIYAPSVCPMHQRYTNIELLGFFFSRIFYGEQNFIKIESLSYPKHINDMTITIYYV